MWNVLNLVLGLVLLMYCLPTVESWDCKKTEIIVGRLGEELELNFPFSDLRDEYNKAITERRVFALTKIQVQDLVKESEIRFKNKMDSNSEDIIYMDGNPTEWVGHLTDIFMANDAFVVKKTKLQKEDTGIYYINVRLMHLGQKALIITGKPILEKRFKPNPVLKPEDNYISTIQLECPSVSTSVGDCPLSMYTVWYRNGMKMTDFDPTLSQINVTVDHNGGNFICLATDYLPCYQRIQTTKHYIDVLKIEECNNVFESERSKVQPEYSPIDVKLDTDQREIIVNKNDDLLVSCSAKCHPECDVIWEKDDQVSGSSNSLNLPQNMFGKVLEIENINSSHEGVYFCLVNNIHGEANKRFTLTVTEAEMPVETNNGNVAVPVDVVYVTVVGVFMVLFCTRTAEKTRAKKNKVSSQKSNPDLSFILKSCL